MNVLWFECTVPGRFRDSGAILGGWQDSLEEIVRDISDIRLTISFEVDKMQKENTLDGYNLATPPGVIRPKLD